MDPSNLPFTPNAPDTVERLRRALAARPRGLFSDIDGTLSAIAPTPEAATLLPGARELLEQAVERFDLVAAVSGRAATTARTLVGAERLLYLGNHGLERLEPYASEPQTVAEADPYLAPLAEALDELATELTPNVPGVRIEPKGVTATIHYRNATDRRAAEAAILRAAERVAEARGLRLTRGRLVVELRPPVAVNKGVAIERVIRADGLRGALYLGDDRTDLDAFRTLRRLGDEGVCAGASFAVLSPEAPAELAAGADATIASVERVPDTLRWLLAMIPQAGG